MADEFTKTALYGIKTFNKKTKEKTRMEKLIMLIDIYEEEVVGVHSVGEKITDKEEARIISKNFGFVKWLIENEKIEPLGKFIGWETDEDEPYIQFDLVDQYIAYLSIQDEPIEFLVSILK